MRSHWRRWLIGLVLAVAVSMSTGEFIELQKLSLDELRTRFKLPSSCDPAVTALTTDPAANQMMVAIDCRVRPASPPGPRVPGERSHPRPVGTGS